MRRINKKEFEINQDPPKEFDLNEIKINEIKKIVNSIFENKK